MLLIKKADDIHLLSYSQLLPEDRNKDRHGYLVKKENGGDLQFLYDLFEDPYSLFYYEGSYPATLVGIRDIDMNFFINTLDNNNIEYRFLENEESL